jgi:acyl-CoA synthetase (NDP forming)
MNRKYVGEKIECVRREGRLLLTEAESKAVLAAYGIPVVEEAVAVSEDDAVARAKGMGFPVVLKGHGTRLAHKTERGLVKLNLRSVTEVRRAYRRIKTAAGGDWEGCLLQPQVEGRREFVAGMFRDPQFGPTVMFGLGGVFAEALADAAFCIAPLSDVQADDLLDDIRGAKLLGDFRGEKAADRTELRRVLKGLSQLSLDHPEIGEVDINPLIVAPDGRVKAVDALVVLSENGVSAADGPREDVSEAEALAIRRDLDAAFNAKSVAVVGAAPPRKKGFMGMYACVRDFGYAGRLYPVNPNISEIDGVKAYPDLVSLPEPVDLVVVSVPAPRVPEVLRDCAAAGCKTVHIFTAGFRETGEPEGIRLQEEMEKIAREGGLRVIGPNCMGVFAPRTQLVTWPAALKGAGSLAFVSQSGGNAQELTKYAASRYGIHFSKAVSYGNALTLDGADYLDYLSHDDETEIVAMYIEGVKDGRRFLKLVGETNRRKPVIIFKGGLSETGARAVSSHTGALAGGAKIWRAFFRQTGAVPVESIEEMADVALAFHCLRDIRGKRTCVLGYGGGSVVSVADNCAKAGLALPAFSPALFGEVRKLVPPVGAMIRNPIDAAAAFQDVDVMGNILRLLAASDEIDNIIVFVPIDWLMNEGDGGGRHIEKVARFLAGEGRKLAGGKPVVGVWRQFVPDPENRKWVPVLEEILLSAGIPVYKGVPRAVNALAKAAAYYAFQERRGS